MKSPKFNIEFALPLTAEQIQHMEEFYELVKSEVVLPVTGMELSAWGRNLNMPQPLPVYGILAAHMNKGASKPEPSPEAKELIESYLEASNVRIEPAPSEEEKARMISEGTMHQPNFQTIRKEGLSPSFAAPYGAPSFTTQDIESVAPQNKPTFTEWEKNQREGESFSEKMRKAKATKSGPNKPVLSVAVLRGMQELVDFHKYTAFRGQPDIKKAIQYMARLIEWKGTTK